MRSTKTQTKNSQAKADAAPVRVAIYVRISQDREGAVLGVARQEEDCRALCTRKGWQVAGVYPDNDVSAYSGKTRKQWERLLADIRDGLIDAICCWHVDRLTRTPRELEDVIDLYDQAGIQLATVTGEIDLSTPTGRLIARTLGAAARHESEHKGERRRRAELQAAQAGKPHITGSRGYGYAPDHMSVVEAEASVIREAAARILAGESAGSVAADLNARGIPTTNGKLWRAGTVREVLTSGRISARREYHGEIVADAIWPAIITVEQSDRLRALLARTGTGQRKRIYLFSRLLRCGRCGGPLWGRIHSNGNRRYMCAKAPGVTGCGRLAVYAEPVEDEIRDQVLTALESPEFLARLMRASAGDASPEDKTISDQIRAIDERRDELAEEWASGDLTRKEWATARHALDDELAKLTRSLSGSAHTTALAQFAGMEGDCWDRWEQLTNGARRALVEATADPITIQPATRGSHAFDPSRIHITWKA
jgi:DNA invertase Pin-like site-specific DNA recombinase